MAVVAGTTKAYNTVGQAEDVHDIIYDISPTETPMLTMAKRKKASAVLHQWQTDALASASSTNAQIEGDDASFATATPTTMLTNYTQISRKTVIVSQTADAVRHYGRSSELARLVTKYGKELKRDIEATLVSSNISTAGASHVSARQSAGFGAMVVNRVFGSGTGTNTTSTVPGYAGGVWVAPTDGTAATFVEADLKDALEAAWTDGGMPSVIMTNSRQKKRISAFAGATAFDGFGVAQGKAQGVVIGGVDVYVSDYSDAGHKVVLNRYMSQSAVYCVDPDHVFVAWLRPIKDEPLAKTGDAEKRQLIGEWTFGCDNPDAHAQIRSLT
jgi:hypothetical protein